MKKVTREEYFESFMNKYAVHSVVGNYPYSSEWTLRGSREVIAKTITTDKDENGERIYPEITEYFIK